MQYGCGDAVLELLGWNAHNQTVERRGDFHLTAEAAAFTHIEREIEHVLFHVRWLTGRRTPRFIDVDVAGCTGASAAAFGFDAFDVVELGGFHDGQTQIGVDRLTGAVRLNERNFGHVYFAKPCACPANAGPDGTGQLPGIETKGRISREMA